MKSRCFAFSSQKQMMRRAQFLWGKVFEAIFVFGLDFYFKPSFDLKDK